MRLTMIAALAAVFAVAPAPAQTPVAVPAFDSIELRGGGHVTVRHGPSHQVRLVRGNIETTRFSVDAEGKLRIDACRRSCRGYRLEVEIVTPELDGAAIEGGGVIRAEGDFPDRGMLALAVSGGGAIDLTAIESGSVAAAVRGGGAIRTHARNSLLASISGGGSITYLGDPRVTSAIEGGGAVGPVE
jgi:putative autotransporter adhesin-like protein